MDRRKSLKVIALGTVSAGVILEACNTGDKKAAQPGLTVSKDSGKTSGRMAEENAQDDKVKAEGTFFTPHEMATITLLGDLIIPKDDVSGSASEAGVPDFIEFIVKDKPEHKLPMRGGLQWLDQQSLKRYNNVFVNCKPEERIALLDMIAYPKKAAKEVSQGVAFFSLMRNLTATGFYTSQIGLKDLNYMGNQPNMWNGVPDEVLKQYGMAYTEKELAECVSYPESK